MAIGNYFTGFSITANRVKGTGTEPAYGQIGTGTGATSASTAMNTPDGARVLGTSSVVTTTNTNDTYQVVFTVTVAGATTIQQVALWDSAGSGTPATGGNMYFISEFAGIALSAGDSITATCKVKYS